MARPRPPTLLVMGLLCCAFALLYGLWLLLYHGGNFLTMLAVAFGEKDAVAPLAQQNLASAGPVAVTLAFTAVQLALVGVLGWAAWGLLSMGRAARRSALAWCAFAAGTALVGTCVRLFFLTLPGEVVKLTPFLMDAVVILFAINLAGTLHLPSVLDAYAGNLEEPTASKTPLAGAPSTGSL